MKLLGGVERCSLCNTKKAFVSMPAFHQVNRHLNSNCGKKERRKTINLERAAVAATVQNTMPTKDYCVSPTIKTHLPMQKLKKYRDYLTCI